jgi:C_GCAxxG_C_C family probable redox protein
MIRQATDPRIVADRAVALGEEGYMCSEAVAMALAPLAGCSEPWARRAAGPFAGGMGGGGGTCGALAAALMLLGIRHGPADEADEEGYWRSRTLCIALARRFAEAMGSSLCAELSRGYDTGTPQGRLALRDSGRPQQMIRCAVELAIPLLEEGAS